MTLSGLVRPRPRQLSPRRSARVAPAILPYPGLWRVSSPGVEAKLWQAYPLSYVSSKNSHEHALHGTRTSLRDAIRKRGWHVIRHCLRCFADHGCSFAVPGINDLFLDPPLAILFNG